jgi:hypothetical protein
MQPIEEQSSAMNTKKSVQLNIPPEFQAKIDAGEYSLHGSLVRDKQGRIVSHLESLDIDDDHYFSPSIFVSFQSLAITSVSTVSARLQNELTQLRASYASIDSKIDRILTNQTNSLIASITHFEEHFSSLAEKSSLTDERTAFQIGTAAAAQLAAGIQSYISDYLGSTVVFYDRGHYDGERYSAYRAAHENQRFPPTITRTNFHKFSESDAFFFTYSFINIINNINIISLCYTSKIYPRYEENLLQVKSQMVDLLSRLIKGLGGEGDIYQMCYSTNEHNKFQPIENINKILAYSDTTIHSLIQRSYGNKIRIEFDEERISSINTVTRIIDDIDNLLQRKEQFDGIDLKELPELEQLKKLTFGE